MNAIELAKAAQNSSKPYVGILANDLIEKIELAYIANWLFNHGESASAITAYRAVEAIHIVYMKGQ